LLDVGGCVHARQLIVGRVGRGEAQKRLALFRSDAAPRLLEPASDCQEARATLRMLWRSYVVEKKLVVHRRDC
jgi:hypothetical protein